MKIKILFSFFVLVSFLGLAQEKKITFDKKYNYQLKEKVDSSMIGKAHTRVYNFEFYTGKTNEYLTIADIRQTSVGFFTDPDGTSVVNFGFNNRLIPNFSLHNNAFNFLREGEVLVQKFAASKLGTKETILGITCDNYILKPVFIDQQEKEEGNSNMKACISDKYGVNNVPVLTSIFNIPSPQKMDIIGSGFIMKLGPEKKYDKEYLILKSVEDVNQTIYFDNKKSLADQKKVTDSLKAEYNKIFGDPNDSLFVPDTAAVVDEYGSFDEGIDVYESTYKKPVLDGSLVVDKELSEFEWKILPKHCRNLDKDLTKFDSAELRKSLRNYVGQMCDMYLTQKDYETVAEKITLDEIRREVLFILENKDKLSKSDQQKLIQYLKKLD